MSLEENREYVVLTYSKLASLKRLEENREYVVLTYSKMASMKSLEENREYVVLTYSKMASMKRLEENREYVVLTYSKVISAESATTVNRLKTAAVHELKECVDTRFLSFDAEGVYPHMH